MAAYSILLFCALMIQGAGLHATKNIPPQQLMLKEKREIQFSCSLAVFDEHPPITSSGDPAVASWVQLRRTEPEGKDSRNLALLLPSSAQAKLSRNVAEDFQGAAAAGTWKERVLNVTFDTSGGQKLSGTYQCVVGYLADSADQNSTTWERTVDIPADGDITHMISEPAGLEVSTTVHLCAHCSGEQSQCNISAFGMPPYENTAQDSANDSSWHMCGEVAPNYSADSMQSLSVHFTNGAVFNYTCLYSDDEKAWNCTLQQLSVEQDVSENTVGQDVSENTVNTGLIAGIVFGVILLLIAVVVLVELKTFVVKLLPCVQSQTKNDPENEAADSSNANLLNDDVKNAKSAECEECVQEDIIEIPDELNTVQDHAGHFQFMPRPPDRIRKDENVNSDDKHARESTVHDDEFDSVDIDLDVTSRG